MRQYKYVCFVPNENIVVSTAFRIYIYSVLWIEIQEYTRIHPKMWYRDGATTLSHDGDGLVNFFFWMVSRPLDARM